jgi:integrase
MKKQGNSEPTKAYDTIVLSEQQVENYVEKTNQVIDQTQRQIQKAIQNEDNLIGSSNLLLNRHVTNKSVWVMDETFIGPFGVFTIHDLKSQSCLGYVINQSERHYLNADHILALLGMLFSNIVDKEAQYPYCIHGDKSPLYRDKEVISLIQEVGSNLSASLGIVNGNQVSESYNASLKREVAKKVIEDLTGAEKKSLLKAMTPEQKKCNSLKRAGNKKIRDLYFQTSFFKKKGIDYIKETIDELNQRTHSFFRCYTREQVEYYLGAVNTDSSPPSFCRENTTEAYLQKAQTALALDTVHHQITYEEQTIEAVRQLIITEPDLLQIARHEELKNLLYAGFKIVMAQNSSLMERQNEFSQKQDLFNRKQDQFNQTQEASNVIIEQLNRTIVELKNHLDEWKKIQTDKKEKQKKFAQRVRRELNQPIQIEHYYFALKTIGEQPTLAAARMRIAITLLFLTGLRVSEVLNVETIPVNDLFEKQRPYISVSRKKGGGTYKKAFLSKYGVEVVKQRRNDFTLLKSCQPKESQLLFYANKSKQKTISREFFTKTINAILKKVGREFDLHFTSHAFRRGYITQLWGDSEDILFVSQAICHTHIETTRKYVQTLSDEQKLDRMERIRLKKQP